MGTLAATNYSLRVNTQYFVCFVKCGVVWLAVVVREERQLLYREYYVTRTFVIRTVLGEIESRKL